MTQERRTKKVNEAHHLHPNFIILSRSILYLTPIQFQKQEQASLTMTLPTGLFTGKVDENCICIICHNVFDEPSSLKCGHTFCLACLNSALDSARRCPTCRMTVPKKGENVIPNRVLKGLIENLTVRCKSSACGDPDPDPDNEPDRQRRRLNPGEASATDDACTWTGKLADWPAHSKSECTLETVSCTVAGCDFRCARKDLGQHTINNTMDHLKLMVSAETEKLRSEFDTKILALQAAHHSQVQTLKAESKNGLVHAQLSSFCRKWMERKPDALFDFVVYRKKIGLTTELLCGVPGPKRTAWEGGLFPLLMTWDSDPDLPPKCKYPPPFCHVNVYPSGKVCSPILNEGESWHRELSVPELLFSLQDHLAHPCPDSPAQAVAYHIYTRIRVEYDRHIKEQSKKFNREDFLGIASAAFKLKPEEWIMVTDTMGGTGLGGQVPTAQSPPTEPTIENANTKDCSCSCCAWGDSSLWDERREMRFLRGYPRIQ
jgi:ubiquitin-conjugating enzyme E2 I